MSVPSPPAQITRSTNLSKRFSVVERCSRGCLMVELMGRVHERVRQNVGLACTVTILTRLVLC